MFFAGRTNVFQIVGCLSLFFALSALALRSERRRTSRRRAHTLPAPDSAFPSPTPNATPSPAPSAPAQQPTRHRRRISATATGLLSPRRLARTLTRRSSRASGEGSGSEEASPLPELPPPVVIEVAAGETFRRKIPSGDPPVVSRQVKYHNNEMTLEVGQSCWKLTGSYVIAQKAEIDPVTRSVTIPNFGKDDVGIYRFPNEAGGPTTLWRIRLQRRRLSSLTPRRSGFSPSDSPSSLRPLEESSDSPAAENLGEETATEDQGQAERTPVKSKSRFRLSTVSPASKLASRRRAKHRTQKKMAVGDD